MKTSWIKGIKDKDLQKEIQLTFKSSLIMRKHLERIIKEKIEAKDIADMKAGNYEVANWAYKMADSQGYKRALYEIISLINDKSAHKT